MKLAIINDTHAGARNSSDIFIKYQEDFYRDVFFPYLVANKIDTILHLGDYFEHRKYVNFKALASNRKHFLSRLGELGIKMFIIPGNHDTYFRNSLELNSLEELLGEYIRNGNVDLIVEPTNLFFDNTSIAMIPWINAENSAKIKTFVAETNSNICAGHFEFAGFEMNPGSMSMEGTADVADYGKFDEVWSGHFHTKSSRGNIKYLGSQFEFTWADCADPKFFHVYDTESKTLEEVRNPLTLFARMVYDDRRMDFNNDVNFNAIASALVGKFVKIIVPQGAKNDQAAFEKFVERVQSLKVHDVKISESFESLEGVNVVVDENFEDTPSLIRDYVDNIETQLDKQLLDKYLQDLYVQALSEEY